MTERFLQICTDREDLSRELCDSFCELAEETIEREGKFRVALSGGSTPQQLYTLLRDEDLDWDHMRLYWGDERNVPLDSEESNARMTRDALLQPAQVPASSYFPVPINVDDPAGAARAYEEMLREEFDGDFPRWDLVLLGLGDDAHTASLFPGTAALDERERWFVENWVPKFDSYRLTLTFPAINSAKRVWFMVAGEGKRRALQNVWNEEKDFHRFPAQNITPDGELTWWLDEAAIPPE